MNSEWRGAKGEANEKMVNSPRFERLCGTRIASTAAALDAVAWPAGTIALRFAVDELYITPPLVDSDVVLALDEHAIIVVDNAFSGARVEEGQACALLERFCEWEIPAERPAFAQGAVAGVPTKLWLTAGQVLFIVPTPYAHEMEARLV